MYSKLNRKFNHCNIAIPILGVHAYRCSGLIAPTCFELHVHVSLYPLTHKVMTSIVPKNESLNIAVNERGTAIRKVNVE